MHPLKGNLCLILISMVLVWMPENSTQDKEVVIRGMYDMQ